MELEFDKIVQDKGLSALYGVFPHIAEKDFTEPDFILDKLDGSLITSYEHENSVRLKSKGSLASTQAIDAMEVLFNSYKHRMLKEGVLMLTMRGYTVIMEYTAPDNRIVLGYDEPNLSVLAVRSNETGEYIEWKDLSQAPYDMFLKDFLAKDETEKYESDMETFIENAYDMIGIEGFIIRLKNGQRVKLKTAEYVSLHKVKDNINSPRRLYETVVNGGTDDLKSLFFEDKVAVKAIDDMEEFVFEKFNTVIDTTEKFYDNNKGLERKEYAILGQKELDRPLFGLAMLKYSGKEPDYKSFMIKNYKVFGIKDEEE